MRTADELLSEIIQTAQSDERIRALTIEGSKVTKGAQQDHYSDLDVTFFVTDIREFTGEKRYMERFGEILIIQYPDDWYSHPYDYQGRENFTFLTQYKDGNRIDLTLVDISKIEQQEKFHEPRKVLLNKDHFPQLREITSKEEFRIHKPCEKEFSDTCNEFRWLSNYVTKGLCRREFYYAKKVMDVYMMDMFLKVLNWKVGIREDFMVTTGANSKYLKRFLDQEEMERFQGIFADGTYDDMWKKLFLFYDYFAELAKYVGDCLGYPFYEKETKEVRAFLQQRKREYDAM